jgi:primosomal protein N'
MPEGSYLYCDVSLPVPLDQPFTYALPETLRHRVRPGSRIVAPFGARKLTGVILRCHDEQPPMAAREALRLIDSEPVLDAELLALGRWIAGYYCAPLGEVLRGMLPQPISPESGCMPESDPASPRRRIWTARGRKSGTSRSCGLLPDCRRSARNHPPGYPRRDFGSVSGRFERRSRRPQIG